MDLLRNNEIVIYETHGMMEVTILKMRYERHEWKHWVRAYRACGKPAVCSY